MSDFYRPTPGATVGHWNVFHRDGDIDHDVPWNELPVAVQRYVRERRTITT